MNDQNALLAALAFQMEAGVDAVIGEAALNRLADSARKAAPAPAAPPVFAAQGQGARVTPAPQAMTTFAAGAPILGGEIAGLPHAVAAAAEAESLPALVKAIEGFEHCKLKHTAKSTVTLDGNPAAQVLIIGEAPGAEEDSAGLPFVGPGGQMLDKMLAAVGLSRQTHVLLCNSLFWRPLGNSQPTQGELSVCLPFIERLIALHQPKILVTLGGSPARTLLHIQAITRGRGKWGEYAEGEGSAKIPALPMLNPKLLLNMPTAKREAWADMRALKAKMEELL